MTCCNPVSRPLVARLALAAGGLFLLRVAGLLPALLIPPTDAGENERAGRWTGFDKAECGIHTFLGDSI